MSNYKASSNENLLTDICNLQFSQNDLRKILKMCSKHLPVLLVTANVGSIFEDPSVMLKMWTKEFLSTVAKLDLKFIALHCQEVGGKNYEKSMKYVEDFVKLLMTSEELRLFDKVRVFIDEDYSSAENFTALGNIYFVHETVEDVLIWDFKDSEFVEVDGQEINTGNIEAIVTKEKAKFPQNFFPECKWSRKGFLRTRWSISGTVFDLINIHLFHDASNFIAMETFPSVYCKNRRRALEHTLQKFHNDRNGPAPFFLFGDFNFRSDNDGVVKKLTEGLTQSKIPHHKSNDLTKLQFHSDDNKLVLTVGKKEFNHSDHQNVFLRSDGIWLKNFDRELEAFENQLYEFPVNFPPSYPFEEKVSCGSMYMQTRCPAWCDRVLLSQMAKKLIDEENKVEYNIMGRDTCMGDHKPVYLSVNIKPKSGIIRCCGTNSQFCSCHYASIEINIIECEYLSGSNTFVVDKTLLHEPFTRDMLLHDPYTPESAESHSPIPTDKPPAFESRTTVSPRILKSRLETILREKDPPLEKPLKNFSRLLTKSQSEHLDSKPVVPQYRTRCLSESAKRNCKARLISTESAQSVNRLQSHHSSSDEDWFEFEETTEDTKEDDIFEEILKPHKDDVTLQTNITELDKKKRINKNKNACCCCLS